MSFSCRSHFSDSNDILIDFKPFVKYFFRKRLTVLFSEMQTGSAALAFEEFLWAKGYDDSFLEDMLEQEFFVRTASFLIPVEVKAKNGTAKSMRTLIGSEKYTDVHCGIKFTGGNIGYSDDIYTFPYFCAFLLKRYLSEAEI